MVWPRLSLQLLWFLSSCWVWIFRPHLDAVSPSISFHFLICCLIEPISCLLTNGASSSYMGTVWCRLWITHWKCRVWSIVPALLVQCCLGVSPFYSSTCDGLLFGGMPNSLCMSPLVLCPLHVGWLRALFLLQVQLHLP